MGTPDLQFYCLFAVVVSLLSPPYHCILGRAAVTGHVAPRQVQVQGQRLEVRSCSCLDSGRTAISAQRLAFITGVRI